MTGPAGATGPAVTATPDWQPTPNELEIQESRRQGEHSMLHASGSSVSSLGRHGQTTIARTRSATVRSAQGAANE